MMDPTTAGLLIQVARTALDRGRELQPHLIGELEAIAASDAVAIHIKREAEAILAIEREESV